MKVLTVGQDATIGETKARQNPESGAGQQHQNLGKHAEEDDSCTSTPSFTPCLGQLWIYLKCCHQVLSSRPLLYPAYGYKMHKSVLTSNRLLPSTIIEWSCTWLDASIGLLKAVWLLHMRTRTGLPWHHGIVFHDG